MESAVPRKEWAKRIAGYGAVAASGIIAGHVKNPELAGWLVSGISLVGSVILNYALPFVFPTARKIRTHFGR